MKPLPNYTVEETLLRGAETALYRGRRDSDGTAVLIKVSEAGAGREATLARLRHEYRLLRDLAVPGVPRVLALETFPAGRALIFEDARGRTLDALLARGRFDLRSALGVGVALAEALEGLHRSGVIYKELCPRHVLCDLAGPHVRLLEFGAASPLAQEPSRAAAFTGDVGLLAYVSPEQTGRMNRTLDTRSDLYSLGVVLFELLAGARPFAGVDEPLALVHCHIARRPPALREVAPEVPEVVSRIVQKLLAKTAEDRYQTASGVKADLERCLRALERGGAVGEFVLGADDRDGRLRLPQRLYGREAEVLSLLAAFARVGAGASELMLIAGYSGIGKSALVHEVNKPIAERGGLFIAGKCEQYGRSVPYAALAQAFRELAQFLLGESAGALADWRARIEGALGPSGRVLIDLVPELELVIGAQPELPALGPSEAQHRLELTLRRFIRAICGPSRPLVLFLDDLQWIDPAALHLVQSLISDPEQGHLLIVGAYRDNEVGSQHLLAAALDTLRKSPVALTELTLQPLSGASVTRLLSDALDLPAREVEELARVLVDKTHGNPFFLGQYLGELCTERLLWFDDEARSWRWELQGVAARVVADNVVALMTTKLRRLPEPTQQTLTLAAAIGHQFDVATLATIGGLSVHEAITRLWPALEATVVVPVGTDYRFLLDRDPKVAEQAEVEPVEVWFRFLHDRVQQAAYSLTPEERLPELHLRIGRLLLERYGGFAGILPLAIFETVRHLNHGLALIKDPDARLALAVLNLKAGRRAKAAAAYEAAAGFLSAGTALLNPGHWDTHYRLAFALHIERGACEYLSGRPEVAEPIFERLAPLARTDLDYAELSSLRGVLYSTQGRFEAVIKVSLSGLERLGFPLPTAPEEQHIAFMAEMAAVPENLGGRRVADLASAPAIEDPRLQHALTILSQLTPACFYAAPSLYGLSLIKQVNLSLKHGNTDIASFGYASYGFLLVGMLGQYELGYEFGRLALALDARYQNPRLTCQLHVVFAMGLHFNRPLSEAIEHHRLGYRAGLESGDVNFLSFGCYNTILIRLAFGDDLLAVAAETDEFLRIATRTKEVTSTALMTLCKQVVANLQGHTRGHQSLSAGDFDEDQFRAEQEGKASGPLLGRYHVFKAELHYLYGDHDLALGACEQAERLLPSMAGLYESTRHSFTLGLTLCALARVASAGQRTRHAERIVRCREALTAWAARCPENYAHRELLLRAEAADLAEAPEAPELYRQAVEAAERSPFVPDLALACECAARHHLARGRREEATGMLLAARRHYTRWGAITKVTLLDRQHQALLFPEEPPQERYIAEHEPVALARATDSPLDALTVLRVAQTITGEIVLGKLIEQIMRTVITHAGAQRGLLILEREGELTIEAVITHDPDLVQLEVGEPVEDSSRLAASVVQYVARTRETVVLGDAGRVGRFSADRYIAAERPKSLLCLALTHQGRLTGVLYLENNLAPNVFAPEQVDLLRMLSSHAAISVQNALLYANVARISGELQTSNAELSALAERLQRELVERERAERERVALQEEVIRVQQSRLAELSTPLIPLTDKIMVMPLIGTVDSGRAQRILEAALEGAHRSRAAVVILDITGLKQVDGHAADSLLQTARALKLLGTAVVLTGIRPEVAQTLVGLGIDLHAVETRGTLQSGIAYALTRVGESFERGAGR